jgi:hypothetical protein
MALLPIAVLARLPAAPEVAGLLGDDVKHGGPYTRICDFSTDSGLLHDRVRLVESFPMGPCSTSGDQNSLRYDLGLTTATATSALSRETPTKETPETAETHVEKRLKRL